MDFTPIQPLPYARARMETTPYSAMHTRNFAQAHTFIIACDYAQNTAH